MDGTRKSYTLGWYIPQRVISLRITGEYSLEDATEANEKITESLDQSEQRVYILIDAMNMARPHNFVAIRGVQTFMDHRNLKSIYVAANDRLLKLAMMVIFNLSRAGLHIGEDLDGVKAMVDQRVAQDKLVE